MPSNAQRRRSHREVLNQLFWKKQKVMAVARPQVTPPPPPSCVQKVEARGRPPKWNNETFFVNEDIEKLWGYGLSDRVYKLLRNPPQNIRYVLDLAKKSDEELLSIKGFGEKALTEVRKVLQTIGCIVLE